MITSLRSSGGAAERLRQKNLSRVCPLGILSLLAAGLLMTGCEKASSPAEGAAGSTQSARGAENDTAPQSAPDEQPRFGQEGRGVGSRVSGTGAGQEDVRSAGSDDQALAQKVLVAISTGTTGTTGVYSEDLLAKIGVAASNGVVTLTGEVGSQSAKEAFSNRASTVHGVRQVRNELRVVEGAARPVPAAPSGRGAVESVPQQDSVRRNP